jgi:hypothetical protein
VNAYMETLTKETSTLHRVLSKHLPEMTVRMIMEPVFKSYKEQWGKAFGDVTLQSEAAQSRSVPFTTAVSYHANHILTGCFVMLSTSNRR